MNGRDLIRIAMPFSSLSLEEWNGIQELQTKVTVSLFTALQTVMQNQAKIEVLSNYLDYYADRLDEPVPEQKITDIQI